MKRTLFVIMFLAVMLGMFTAVSADEITIGTGTYGTYEPIASYYGYHRSAAIYTSGEVGGSGTITTISYKASNTSATTIPIRVYMKMTTAASLLPAVSWPTLISGLTPLYDGTHSGATLGEWKTITLTTPFQFTGNNLMILIESNYGGSGTSGPQWYYSTATNMNQYIRKDNSAPTTETGSVTGSRPVIRLNIDGYTVFAPTFTVNPTNVGFGVVSINTTTAYTNVTVSNSGAGTLNVSSVMLGGSDAGSFILDMNSNPSPWALTAGQSKTVKVAFNPTEERSYNAYLRFAGDVRVDHDVLLSGSGVDPTIDDFPYANGFENGGAMPAGWTVTAGVGATLNWQCVTADASNGASGPQAGTYFARLNVYSASASYNPYSLVSPPIDLSSGNKRISFYAWIGSAAAAAPLGVEISTDNQANWTNLISFNNTSNTNAWFQTILSLAAYPSSSAYIRFKGTSNYGYGSCNLGLDSIVIDDLPAEANFAINPTSWNYGQVDLAVPPVTKVFTISNTGGAPLELSSIAVTEGGDVFSITVGPEMTVNPGGSTNFTVQFDPQAVTSYTGNVQIIDNTGSKATHDIPLSGEGYARPAGSTCENPYDVVLPLDDFTGDTSLYGDDYSDAWVTPSSYYLGGDDMVLRFTLAVNSSLSGTLTAVTGSYIGMLFTQAIPNPTTPAPLLGSATNGGTVATLTNLELAAGTYYLILSTWPAPQSFTFSLDLTATPLATDPVFQINPTAWDYGQVMPGNSVAKVFTITNTGGGTLFIDKDDVTITGSNADQFSLEALAADISLVRNATAQITVNFGPESEGIMTANLQIIDNIAETKASQRSGAKSTHIIQLDGEGYDPSVSSFPYAESFDGSTFAPAGWINQQISGPGEGLWERTLVGTNPDCLPHSGEAMAEFNCFSYNDGTSGILVTPPLSFGDADYQVSFWMYRDSGYSSESDQLNVYAGAITNINAATWLGTVNRHLDLEPVVDEAGWYKYSFPIPEILMKGVGYIFFEAVSDYGNNIFIDDVSIEEASQGVIPIDPGNPGMPPNGVEFTPGGPVPPALLGEDSGLPALIYTISATGVWDVLVLKPMDWNTDWYCWIMAGTQLLAGPNPIPSTTPDYTFAGVNFDAKGDVTVVVNDNQTLPVELSSFTAVLTADMFVRIAWMTESETNHLGYNILRGSNDSVSLAQRLNASIIDEGTGLGSQVSYDFTDAEVDAGSTYYYWLESVDLGGLSTLFGPLTITVSGQPNDPGAPEIPSVTQLQTAFPNPFNPSTTLRYSLKQAGKVRLEIYNLKGQLIRRFERDHQHPGYYQQVWDGKDAQGNNVTSGVYIYRMVTGKYSSSRKMVLSK